MISKPLFKQSCKANLGLWSFVTTTTCIILAVLILVIGSLDVSTVSNSMVNIFVSDAIEASVKKQSTSYYDMTEAALTGYSENTSSLNYILNTALSNEQKSEIISSYDSLISSGKSDSEAREILLASASDQEKQITNALLNYYLAMRDPQSHTISYAQEKINEYVLRQIEEDIYQQLIEENGEESANYSKTFIHQAVTDFVASGSDNASDFATFYIPNVLKEIFYVQKIDNDGKTIAIADHFTKDKLGDISLSSILSFKAELNVKISQRREQISTENPEYTEKQINEIIASETPGYKTQIIESLSGSLLDDLPEEIASSLKELGNLDIAELVIGSMFFKMAGILLPIVYIIMASNNLMASQVDSGSMAYVLSTPTKRKTVSITQLAFLVLSLFAMFLCTTIVGFICLAIAGNSISIGYGSLALLNLGAFITMFAIAGICFLSSSFFNRSKLSMSIGGGLSMFFFVATILGLFGSSTVPGMLRVDAMNFFNFLSIISLFDCVSILHGSLTFLWKLAILLGIGIAAFIAAIIKFKKKDLPL